MFRRLAARWRSWRRRSTATSDAVGRRGERAAVRHLRREGYRILARRLRTGGGEVDVLALDGETLALVEVKAAVASRAGGPARRVDRAKRRRLSAAWSALARRRGLASRACRLDVVAVTLAGRSARCVLHRGFARLT